MAKKKATSAAKKAAVTRKRKKAGKKAAVTRKRKKAAKKAATTRKLKTSAKKAVKTRKWNRVNELAESALDALEAGNAAEARTQLRAILKTVPK